MQNIRALTAAIAIAGLVACGSSDLGSTPDADPNAPDSSANKPVVVIATSLGDLVVELEHELMPITTANFLAYVDSGWFDSTLVHRVLDDWVIQGGGFTTGMVEKTPNAPITLETSALVTHVHGAISMARTSDPNSATTQWFIVDWPNTGTPPQPGQLDGSFAAFGVVIEGLDVLTAITQVATGTVGNFDDVPNTEITVTSAARRDP